MITVSACCDKVDMSRQNYYAERKEREERELDEALVLDVVRRERASQPRLGTRKLLILIGDELAEKGVSVGRDRLFDVLRAHGMLVERKRGKPRTTNSRHTLPVFHNLIVDVVLERPNQVWVSDITYISTDEGWMYAALIMDLYSRKIVGWHLGESLEAMGCVLALKMALRTLPEGARPIHHSDRGCQYCCHEYVDLLLNSGLEVSMTEVLHCYENAAAERLNGILKQEYELDVKFRTKSQALKAFKEAVFLYNNRRPHMGIGYKFPESVHKGEECARREASPLLRLAQPSALRAAPSGTGLALRSRGEREGAGSEATRKKKAQPFLYPTIIESGFDHKKTKIKEQSMCQI